MFSKLGSKIFGLLPENNAKHHIRAFVHRARQKEYLTYYKNNVWELHYPEFVIKYKDVPSPAENNYFFFKKFVDRPFDIVIDAGGFIGTFGFLMASKYPNAKVYIFEADPVNYDRIMTNLALNNLPNVTVEKLGLWDKTDVLQMSVSSDLSSSVVNHKSQNDTVDIHVTSIDEYFPGVSNKTIFVKMNIEGAEIAALNGATEFLKNNKVDLAISTDHTVDGELTYIAVEKIFKNLGMPAETLSPAEGSLNTFSTNISEKL